jgi:hypothetical protein
MGAGLPIHDIRTLSASLRRRSTVMMSAIRFHPRSPTLHHPSHQGPGYGTDTTVGFEGFEGGEHGGALNVRRSK